MSNKKSPKSQKKNLNCFDLNEKTHTRTARTCKDWKREWWNQNQISNKRRRRSGAFPDPVDFLQLMIAPNCTKLHQIRFQLKNTNKRRSGAKSDPVDFLQLMMSTTTVLQNCCVLFLFKLNWHFYYWWCSAFRYWPCKFGTHLSIF